ncbi:uncharacterized protein LOC121066993 [Cygnus olor]|uniref:uncharacterized protein LOC121066993 n=1 Tax=Cygnus olor TaxID=8869 RepID=UPI001ADE0704|nr:uncharacterized protein LOC121066993 [Cygnus olor]
MPNFSMEETLGDLPCDLNTRSCQSPAAGNQEMHRQMKVQEENDNFQTKLTISKGEINTRLKTKQPNLRLNQASQPDLEKLTIDMELTMLKCQYEEKQRERQYKEKMCFLQLQSPAHSDERLQDSHVPQDQIALLLYCFIFILLINTAKELLFFFVEKHELFVIALTLLYIIKNLWNYLLVISSSSPISAFSEIPDRNLQCSDVRMKGTLQEGSAM